jgi:hypothetical protein
MSEKLPQQPQNEEVDLGQLFSALGKLFDRLFAFIGKILKSFFSLIIYVLKPLVDNFKIIVIILTLAALVGFVFEKLKKPVYVSHMLVKPYFESKYQLANNVDYFNALIGSGSLKELSDVFEIDTVAIKNLLGFEIKFGPETQNDLLIEYDNYIKSIDSSLAEDVTYDKFIENRDIFAGTIYSITAISKSNNIFPSLEKGFIKTFENKYSKKLKRKSDSIYKIKKNNYLEEIARVESLQNVYIEIKKSEANSGQIKLGSGSLFPLSQEKSTTKEFELFQEELKIRASLRLLEEERYDEQDYYDILSSFEEVGSEQVNAMSRYTLFFPIVIFGLMIIVFFLFKVFIFIKNYE